MGKNDINSLSHSKWNCKYHVVFAMVFSITHLTVVMYENGKYPIPYDVAPNQRMVDTLSRTHPHHFKSAHQIRNRFMVDRSDLVIFCVGHNSGGAYQTMQYAKKANANIVNLSDVTH